MVVASGRGKFLLLYELAPGGVRYPPPSKREDFAMKTVLKGALVSSALALCVAPVLAHEHEQFVQQAKLVGSPTNDRQMIGDSVALSFDGDTAIIAGPGDNELKNASATFVFKRTRGNKWVQQTTLSSPDQVGTANFYGMHVDLSNDGRVALVSGPTLADGRGAGYLFERLPFGGQWKKTTTMIPMPSVDVSYPLALAADGNTAIFGSPALNDQVGAAFVFARHHFGTWKQQAELIGSGDISLDESEGTSVTLSSDGNTAVIGAPVDGRIPADGSIGAAFVFTREFGRWRQQAKLIGTGVIGSSSQGESVAISADGNTILVGGGADDNSTGATWVFTRSYETWTQQGLKLVGNGIIPGRFSAGQGASVALSDDGNTAAIGGPGDDNGTGAVWVFAREGGVWSQRAKLVGAGVIGEEPEQGSSVAISGDGHTILSGGPGDGNVTGAVWVFSDQTPLLVSKSD
jgi:hypothetical protein